MAKILFSPKGAARSNWFKFSAKIAMAFSSAFVLASCKVSFEMEGSKSLL